MSDCIFCKIIAGEIPSAKVYEDEYVYAFKDINPQAPVHVLIVPKVHAANLLEALEKQPESVARVMSAVPQVARAAGIDQFRLITNCGEQAGQTVPHLHFHVLSGRDMTWPPG